MLVGRFLRTKFHYLDPANPSLNLNTMVPCLMIPVMTVSALKTRDLSARLTDIVCLNDVTGLPRYWATVWASHFGADLQSGTLRKHLSAIDALYRSAERQIGDDCLDRLLFELDVPLIEGVASGFFNEERNRSIQYGIDTSQRWNSANRFLFDVMQLGIGVEKDNARVVSAHASLVRLGLQLKNLSPSPRKKSTHALRALPSVVIEELYDVANPESPRNPFRTDKARWRNFCIVLAMLHQGLRTAEVLLQPVGAIKHQVHPGTGEIVHWLNVDTRYEDEDPRWSRRPKIKTENSIRQIPVAPELAEYFQYYEGSFRGRQSHPMLFVNPSGGALSGQAVLDIFSTLSRALSDDARQTLIDNMRDPVIRAHDLRHTCAVLMLTRFRESGIDDAEAQPRLRAFFGWSYSSEMPRHYARAYYETRLGAVWQQNFDANIEILRTIDTERETWAGVRS